VARLEELRLSVAEGRCEALLALGAHEVALAELEAHVLARPLHEHGCELLALAFYRAGRQADALAMLRATRRRLAEELGIDPVQRCNASSATFSPMLPCWTGTGQRAR
jgi:DNA-binding SARP family transcriptional activator